MTGPPEPVLAIDTSTATTAVAVSASGVRLETPPPPPGWQARRPRHSEEVLPIARELLARSGISFRDVRSIVVGVGPGTFTGLRIGVTTARALAQALDIPIWKASTLDCLAVGAAGGRAGGAVMPAIDAKRGELFVSLCAIDGRAPPVRLRAERAASPPEAIASATSHPGPVLAVGNGAVSFRDAFRSAGVEVPAPSEPVHAPRASNLIALARTSEPQPIASILPEYARAPDAELSLIRRRVALGEAGSSEVNRR